MSLDPKAAKKSNRKPIPTGLHAARCFAIIDLGHQPKSYQGVEKDPTHEVMICFELTKFMISVEEGKPQVPSTVYQKYTFSIGDKAKLPKMLKSWFALTKPVATLNLKPLLGKYATLNMEHTEGKDGVIYSNIANNGLGILPPFEGEEPKAFYSQIWFDLDQFSWKAFNELPKYAQETIRKSQEWPSIMKKNPEQVASASVVSDDGFESGFGGQEDDDIPF